MSTLSAFVWPARKRRRGSAALNTLSDSELRTLLARMPIGTDNIENTRRITLLIIEEMERRHV